MTGNSATTSSSNSTFSSPAQSNSTAAVRRSSRRSSSLVSTSYKEVDDVGAGDGQKPKKDNSDKAMPNSPKRKRGRTSTSSSSSSSASALTSLNDQILIQTAIAKPALNKHHQQPSDSTDASAESRNATLLERNRLAANRFRQKKKEITHSLQVSVALERDRNNSLRSELQSLQMQISFYNNQLQQATTTTAANIVG